MRSKKSWTDERTTCSSKHKKMQTTSEEDFDPRISTSSITQRLMHGSLEELNQAAIEQVVEVDDDTPLEIYFTTASNLLKEAKASRESQDLERMYKCLIQYLILVVKKLPTHKDMEEDEDEESTYHQEYEYNLKKCDLVKQEIEKLRNQLTELYQTKNERVVSHDEEEVEKTETRTRTRNSDDDRRKSVIQPIVPTQTPVTIKKLDVPTSPMVLNKNYAAYKSAMKTMSNPNLISKTPTMLAQRSRNNPDVIVRVRLLPGIIEHEGPNTPNSVYHLVKQNKPQMRSQSLMYNVYQNRQPQQPSFQQPQSYQQPRSQQPQYVSQPSYTPINYQQQPRTQQQPQYVPQPNNRTSTSSTNIYPQTNSIETVYNSSIERVATNEQVQEYVGKQVGNLAQNEKVQKQVGAGVSNAAKNEKVQSSIGNVIASNSDNYLVQSLATNKQVQSTVGSAIANTAGNEKVQKAVGNAIHKAATDKEVQKKVATGFMTAAKGAFSLGKAGAKVGYNMYQDSNQQ